MMKEIARKIDRGERLSPEDALFLFEEGDLLGLGELASKVNGAKSGDRVYYNVNRHINPTNICVNRCKFCAFSRSEGEEGAYLYTLDEVMERAAEAAEQGATELHLVGGLHPTLSLDWYLEAIKKVKVSYPGIHVKGFTAVEIDHFAKISDADVKDVLKRLMKAGLGSMPGGGAEILAEENRAKICPEKISGARWLEIMEVAHGLGLKTNATMLYGHVESYADRVEHMRLLREVQDRTGGFQVFIPLAFQPTGSEIAKGAQTTGFDDLKVLSIARLFLDNFDHVKGYWVMLGEKIAQLSLAFGVDDLDGTVVEEKIAHDAGATSRSSMTRERIEALIREAGKTPVERDSLYNIVGEGTG
ncbi:MAG: aminofutalosine synthase MqnE [Deltaproteobacteria bacterium]|nr:MAG: aminofutalosine synthase MqnE [Deltaproteobacteria bacterium]